jgi:hypothetical protein
MEPIYHQSVSALTRLGRHLNADSCGRESYNKENPSVHLQP